jgi:hypothetical protein
MTAAERYLDAAYLIVFEKTHGPAVDAPSSPPPVMNDYQPESTVIFVVAFAALAAANATRTAAPSVAISLHFNVLPLACSTALLPLPVGVLGFGCVTKGRQLLSPRRWAIARVRRLRRQEGVAVDTVLRAA